jgi:hypothetical protein
MWGELSPKPSLLRTPEGRVLTHHALSTLTNDTFHNVGWKCTSAA